MNILGISCFYHDSSATLLKDGEVVAAAAEERFSRDKHDNSFPKEAASYCLEEGQIDISDVDKVVFYEKPLLKFDRILETSAAKFPKGFKFFSEVIPEWIGTKLRIRKKIRKELEYQGDIEFTEHHFSHAASTFYPSPFNKAAILTVDGVGEWTTNQMFEGSGNEIEPLNRIEFPNSIGLLYSTITAYLGFMVNNDEYKVMGLASYGEPSYRDEFNKFLTVNEDGSYQMDQDYFSYSYQRKMWSEKLEELLGEPREEGEELSQRHKDIAATLQKMLEEVLLNQVNHLYDITDTENLCMAGGVALNSAANGRIKEEMPFDNIWIQPAAGDGGGSLGAALERAPESNYEMNNVYLGPEHADKELKKLAENEGLQVEEAEREELMERAVSLLTEGKVIGLYQGRLEWGPRALGNRSILADPRKEEMIDTVNKKIKFRESFRPFAPTVLEERSEDYFDINGESPYMLFVHDVLEGKKDEIPAVTHTDGTSRMQTLKQETNPFYHDLIGKFEEETGVPVLLNTSFNLKGMPIVNRPKEAIDVLKRSDMDSILTRSFLIRK
jgi:carbamoyltransferase